MSFFPAQAKHIFIYIPVPVYFVYLAKPTVIQFNTADLLRKNNIVPVLLKLLYGDVGITLW